MTAIQPYNMPGKIFCYGSLTCSSPMQVCCDLRVSADGGSSFMTSCAANAAACPTGAATYECGQAADCGSGQVCCGTQGTSGKGLKSTQCAASCGTGQIQLCVTKTECKTGTMCVGADLSGRDVGVCM